MIDFRLMSRTLDGARYWKDETSCLGGIVLAGTMLWKMKTGISC